MAGRREGAKKEEQHDLVNRIMTDLLRVASVVIAY
jgi:hypothetical protein